MPGNVVCNNLMDLRDVITNETNEVMKSSAGGYFLFLSCTWINTFSGYRLKISQLSYQKMIRGTRAYMFL